MGGKVNNLNRAREYFWKLTPAEQRFIKYYFTENRKPNRWKFPDKIKHFPNKWSMLKGFKYFKKLTVEELEKL